SGTPSIWNSVMRFIHFGVLGFFAWRSVVLYRRRKRLVALLLGISTALFLLSGLWGVLIDLGRVNSIYFGGFVFIFLMIMMSISLTQDRKRDVIELRRSKESIQSAEERYRDIFENAVEGMFQTTPDGKILLVNPSFASMYGFDSPEEMVRSIQDFTQYYVDPEKRNEAKRLLNEQGFVKGFETKLYRKDRSIMWVSASVRAVRDNKGNLLYFEGTNEDITKRKEFEEAFLRAEERYRNIFDNAVEGIFQSTPEGKLLLVNPALASRAGFNSPEEMINSVQDAANQYVEPKDRSEMKRLLEEQGFVKDFETRLYRPDRTIAWNSMNVRAIRDATGNIHHYDGWVEDITRRKLLIEVSNSIVSTLDLKELYCAIRPGLLHVIPADFIGITLYNADKKQIQLKFIDYRGHQNIFQDMILNPADGSPLSIVLESMQAVCVDSVQSDSFPSEFMQAFRKENIGPVCCLPLTSHGVFIGIFTVASCSRTAFTSENIDFLKQITSQIAIAIDNALAYRQISDLKNKLSEEKLYLEEEISSEHNFGEIIGNSVAIRDVLKQVEIVSPTESSVLILGETGTGKELIARAIHRLSGRRERNFVKMNCAAVPAGLIESELFGHEKGAFTGAVAQRIGRFELAHQGTIFLDEVGDIPLELQTKLLRVLQEHEFERLGSTKTIKVDVRLITATNRDLAQMVSEKQFRSDLYYRLKVFPIQMPPLRDRTEDIPLLVRHFTEKHAKKMNKQIINIPSKTMESLMCYAWRGNIRELENLLERAVILSPGSTLQVPLSELVPIERPSHDIPNDLDEEVPTQPNPTSESGTNNISTLEEAEREHILRALKSTNWVIAGAKGAAAYLGLNRSTLRAKIRKLGIIRHP
ncbi:MAG: sigma 54-interacting transcriptional regulator, partial [Nitrospiria bacterium]